VREMEPVQKCGPITRGATGGPRTTPGPIPLVSTCSKLLVNLLNRRCRLTYFLSYKVFLKI
jgi:hypothetical protein